VVFFVTVKVDSGPRWGNSSPEVAGHFVADIGRFRQVFLAFVELVSERVEGTGITGNAEVAESAEIAGAREARSAGIARGMGGPRVGAGGAADVGVRTCRRA
jgi:hypothetical protein